MLIDTEFKDDLGLDFDVILHKLNHSDDTQPDLHKGGATTSKVSLYDKYTHQD
jgi:hypothetical protein